MPAYQIIHHMLYLKPSQLERPGTVIIDDRDPERASQRTLAFVEPIDVLIARSPDEVADTLARIDDLLDSGKHLAGYISYDAGLVLDKPIASSHQATVPLIWLGVYDSFSEVDLGDLEYGSPDDVTEPQLNVTEGEYLCCIDRIRDYIAAGDVYQVNYTVKLIFEHSQPAWKLFARLRRAHPVGYSAYINTGDARIVSLSPELFLRREGDHVLTRPMKGTARRGRWFEEDAEIARSLGSDEKNRAENIMIVDLMRNDIGRVCEMGAVSVPRTFHVERYGSLHQMTSDVEGRLREGTRASDLLRAVFPPGSITGAPKIRAMEIIDELEAESRGVYCGSIGYLSAGGDCLLNVAIRTIVQRGNQCEMGVGSGIVWDSDPRSELSETLLKGSFVASAPQEFELLETILYRVGEGYIMLDAHLTRMRQSAEYFGRCFPEADLRKALDNAAGEMESHASELTQREARVRLLLGNDGSCRAEWADAGMPTGDPVNLLLGSRQTDPNDIFLYHKTTRREAYDAELHDAREKGFFDALHMNTRGKLTEGSITNILVEIDGHWCTPPLESGLLPGIWRMRILECGLRIAECGMSPVEERVLTLEDLRRATRVIVGNSVRGAIKVGCIVSEEEDQVFAAVRSSTSDISGNISL